LTEKLAADPDFAGIPILNPDTIAAALVRTTGVPLAASNVTALRKVAQQVRSLILA
jgi:hypothetical protein